MDFFGFNVNAAADDASSVGVMIRAATEQTLEGPDWGKNMSICDLINGSSDSADAERAARCLLRRLQESDPKVVELSLTIAETCMKNCLAFMACIEQPFMDEMVGITRGKKGKHNAAESLRLIQQWAKGLQKQKNRSCVFDETYLAMKTRGISFPDEDGSAASFDIPPPAISPGLDTQSMFRSKNEQEFQKLEVDLITVFEKVKLCREMLRVSPGIQTDEALAEVVGFLEACRDRMADVIEAGTQGLLNEELLAKCFRANDAIFRTLDAEKNGTSISVDCEEDDMKVAATADLLSFDDTSSTKKPAAVKAAKMDDDDFSLDLMPSYQGKPSASASASASSAAPATVNDIDLAFGELFGSAASTTKTPAPAPAGDDIDSFLKSMEAPK